MLLFSKSLNLLLNKEHMACKIRFDQPMPNIFGE